jgi:ribulose-5-phosphate 4-epimerase/fuculose-1-phosphate aldolase
MAISSRICASLQSQVSDIEWGARQELAAFYRVVFRHGWSQLVNNHITARVPGTTDQFLLNPHGLSYDEITASSLMKIDLAGEIVLQPRSRAGNQLYRLRHSRRRSQGASRSALHRPYTHSGRHRRVDARLRIVDVE